MRLIQALQSDLDHNIDTIDHHLTILTALTAHHLDAATLDTTTANTIFHNTSNRANSLGFVILPQDPIQLLQCPTSFILQKGLLKVFIHVPIALKEMTTLNTFQYIPTPIQLTSKTNIIFKPDTDFIAISETKQTFLTLSKADMQQCMNMGNLFICFNVILYQFPSQSHNMLQKFCTFYLYKSNLNAALQTCDTHTQQPQTSVIPLAPNKALISPKESIHAIIQCTHDIHTTIPITTNTILTIPPTCSIQTDGQTFIGHLNLDVAIIPFHYKWPLTQKETIHQLGVQLEQDLQQQHIDVLPPQTPLRPWIHLQQTLKPIWTNMIWNAINSTAWLTFFLAIIYAAWRLWNHPSQPTPNPPTNTIQYFPHNPPNYTTSDTVIFHPPKN